MKLIVLSLAIGAGAAIIDVIPMLIRKLDSYFVISAAIFWIIIGFLAPRLNFTGTPWIDGILLAILYILPMIPLLLKLDLASLPIILPTTVVLGAAVGWLSGLLVK